MPTSRRTGQTVATSCRSSGALWVTSNAAVTSDLDAVGSKNTCLLVTHLSARGCVGAEHARGLTEGLKLVPSLGYAPLPPELVERELAALGVRVS
jgi:hypothetical protein